MTKMTTAEVLALMNGGKAEQENEINYTQIVFGILKELEDKVILTKKYFAYTKVSFEGERQVVTIIIKLESTNKTYVANISFDKLDELYNCKIEKEYDALLIKLLARFQPIVGFSTDGFDLIYSPPLERAS
ncbi:MAG: hypothetical protein ACMG57_00755 [Candidatus Dojkabacteria bacterium]